MYTATVRFLPWLTAAIQRKLGPLPGAVLATMRFPSYPRATMHDDEWEASPRVPRSRLGAVPRSVSAPLHNF